MVGRGGLGEDQPDDDDLARGCYLLGDDLPLSSNGHYCEGALLLGVRSLSLLLVRVAHTESYLTAWGGSGVVVGAVRSATYVLASTSSASMLLAGARASTAGGA